MATQDSDNPDLRDRGFIYWRLLSTDPAAAKEVVLAEKPLISEETDLLEPTLLDELICHIGSLASVYHKPPSAFVEGAKTQLAIAKGISSSGSSAGAAASAAAAPVTAASAVIPSADSLIGDLLSIDLGGGFNPPQPTPAVGAGGLGDVLGGGLDSLLGDVGGAPAVSSASIPPSAAANNTAGLLGDIFGVTPTSAFYTLPKQCWLEATKGKGLEVNGTFARRNGQLFMDMTLSNKAMGAMSGFAVQFNKNSFGIIPSQPLNVPLPLQPSYPQDISLPLTLGGPVQKMTPLTNIQVAIKNNVDVLYFSCLAPMHALAVEDGQMDKKVFLATWKDIPPDNELQYEVNNNTGLSSDQISAKLQQNNMFTIAKRSVDGQDMLYLSLKLVNGIWVLAELKIQPTQPVIKLSVKCRAPEVSAGVHQIIEEILQN